jgi:predicted DNA-binding transcriptional regulator AlpA
MAELTRSVRELQAWLHASLPGTLVDAQVLAQALAVSRSDAGRAAPAEQPTSWRERLWVVPPDTRLGVAELLEALGRTRSWLYRHTGPSSPRARIPHRKLDGELVFLASEVRQWLLESEVIVVPGKTTRLGVTRTHRLASAGRTAG